MSAPCLPNNFGCSCAKPWVDWTAQLYVDAQSSANVTVMQPVLSSTTVYIEDNQVVDINTGLLSKPFRIDHTEYPEVSRMNCRARTQIVVSNDTGQYRLDTVLQGDQWGHYLESINTTVIPVEIDWKRWLEVEVERRSAEEVAGGAA